MAFGETRHVLMMFTERIFQSRALGLSLFSDLNADIGTKVGWLLVSV
jgi:hypothetical protein